jgi:hypothetical protein
MQIKLDHLDRLVLEIEADDSNASGILTDLQEFQRGAPVSEEPAHRVSLFVVEQSGSENNIFSGMVLPVEGHGDYSKWAIACGHGFDALVTVKSFDRIARRLVEVASASVRGGGKMRISSHDLKALFSDWMDSTF